MWNVLSFTLAKAGKGRACSPVVFDIAFTSFITLSSKWTTALYMIHIDIKGPQRVCVWTVSAVADMLFLQLQQLKRLFFFFFFTLT